MEFTEKHSGRAVPTWIATVPERTLAAGADETIKPAWRPVRTIVQSTGPADLNLYFGSVAYVLLAGARLDLGGAWKSLKVENPSGTLAGGYTLIVESARTKTTDVPELTTAEGFPAFDASDPNAIVPGV